VLSILQCFKESKEEKTKNKREEYGGKKEVGNIEEKCVLDF